MFMLLVRCTSCKNKESDSQLGDFMGDWAVFYW